MSMFVWYFTGFSKFIFQNSFALWYYSVPNERPSIKVFLSKWLIPVNMKTCLRLLHQCNLLLFQINSRILPNLNLYPILPLFPSVFCSNISWISIFIVALTQLHLLLLFLPHFFFPSDLIFYFEASLLVHHFPFLQLYVCLTTLR